MPACFIQLLSVKGIPRHSGSYIAFGPHRRPAFDRRVVLHRSHIIHASPIASYRGLPSHDFLSSSRSRAINFSCKNGLNPRLRNIRSVSEAVDEGQVWVMTYIPWFVTILYVPLAWKLPRISPLPSTSTLPRMSSGLGEPRQPHSNTTTYRIVIPGDAPKIRRIPRVT
jgi:hypothetical protein